MSRHFLPALFAATATFALPHTFKTNDPAKASQVNDNFRALDSAVGTKADQSVVSALATAISTKSDASLKDSIGARVDTASFHAFKKKLRADSAKVEGDLAARPVRSWVDSELASRPNRTWVDSVASAKANLTWKDSLKSRVDTGTFQKALRQEASDLSALQKSVENRFAGSSANAIAQYNEKGALAAAPLVVSGSALNSKLRISAPGFFGTIEYQDTRDSASTPLATLPGVRYDFKRCGTEKLSGQGDYCGEMTYRPWGSGGDFSGGPTHQLMFTGAGNLAHRTGDATGWKAWRTIAFTNDPVRLLSGTVEGDLHVQGNLTTKPNIPVADYVFEPGYKLAPLAEVEAFTKEHKHLPEIPSAKVIEANGLDLAQMNLLLLKKVEELTLHAIQQQKVLEDQAKTNEELRRGLEELQVKIGR